MADLEGRPQRKVTHEMAREAFRKMHNALYGGAPVPMMSIPARLDDADIVLSDYICQQKAVSTPPPARCSICNMLPRHHAEYSIGHAFTPVATVSRDLEGKLRELSIETGFA